MRLRSQTHAALRALLDLSLHGASQAPVPVSDIAKRQGLGVAFLEQLFRPLKKAGLVAPWRGMKGGYTLAKPAEAVTLLEVLAALDDPSVRPIKSAGPQPSAEAQAVAALLENVEAGLGELLAGVSLEDLKQAARANPLLKDAPRAGTGFQI
ncbi:MAG TPA: Rrf2 family transcriptional regulator [bacterium]|jgi:Rrf2 family protein|nr:Rrf2 family transcriptional regulator [bacterium]